MTPDGPARRTPSSGADEVAAPRVPQDPYATETLGD
jgi:hypothetical protein